MKNSFEIVKFDEVCGVDAYKLRRLTGTITARSMIGLISIADLHANPREAKAGMVTDAIIECLEETPELYPFKSKGILISAGECEALERKRFRLSFQDDDIEGVLDGGHNMLGIALFVLRMALPNPDSQLRGVKRWDQVIKVWNENRELIKEWESEFDFLVPVEIVYPHDGPKGRDEFEASILDIAQARNNNAQLTIETKAHKAGYYEHLKAAMDPELSEEVEWKTNDGGRIRAREVVALSWVALSKLDRNLKGVKDFNPVSIYRNKGMCVQLFNRLIEDDAISVKGKAETRSIRDKKVKSALQMMKQLPSLYDEVFARFPEVYNEVSSGFGRIRSVRLFEKEKYTKGEKKYLPNPPVTRYYKKECKYDYPEGFIMPIVFALSELMQWEGDKLIWTVDPWKFLEDKFVPLVSVYYGFIQLADYDPQRVGKQAASYNLARQQVQALLKT